MPRGELYIYRVALIYSREDFSFQCPYLLCTEHIGPVVVIQKSKGMFCLLAEQDLNIIIRRNSVWYKNL